MKRCLHAATLACGVIAILTLVCSAGAVLGPAFSLDDNPQQPLTSPLGHIPGLGAEDPYGLGTFGGSLAPSPSLAIVPAMDSDILSPNFAGGMGPMLDMPMSRMHNQTIGYVDAVTDNKYGRKPALDLLLGFSVDRISIGLAPGDVFMQSQLNQQPGDIYRTEAIFPHPMQFAGIMSAPGYAGGPLAPGMGLNNRLLFDESRLSLTAGNGVGNYAGPSVMCPPIMPGSHDNVDAANWHLLDINPKDALADRDMFFSVPPDERSISGFGPCDFLYIPAWAPASATTVYAPGNWAGLYDQAWEWEDNIDGLVIWESPQGQPGVADRGLDMALFSLSHGSPSLQIHGLSESDIFFTNFTGSFWLYTPAVELGLNWFGPQEGGDNVDALEVMLLGDANLDGVVNLDDFIILKKNYGSGTSWLQGDFDGDGTVNLNDFIILKQHYGMTL